MTFKIGIIGASGYTGIELLRILGRHSEFELVTAVALEAWAKFVRYHPLSI